MKIKNRLFSLYMKVNYIVAAAMMMVTVSCTEQIEMETSAGTTLQIKVVDDGMFDSEKGGTRAAYSGLTTTFEDGDNIGIYAVQGTTVINANVKATLTDGVWVLNDQVIYDNSYTYFAYYPYQVSPAAPNFAQSTLDAKFASMISGWTPAADQSTTTAFKSSDLMLAQGTNTSNNVISFQMTHKMALAVFENTRCTMSYSTAPNTKIPATHLFVGNVPIYNSTENKYYYIMTPNTLTTVGGISLKAGTGKYIQKRMGDITDSYTLSYSTDNGNSYSSTKPSWLTSVVETRGVGETLNFCVYATNEKTTDTNLGSIRVNPSREILSVATPVTDYDLSTNGGTTSRTTANCYMVHAPGTYKLPLVYGNAIKNGSTNTSAYISTASGPYIRSNFTNHAGDNITGPWLKDHAGATPTTAELLWQDARGLISQVGISGDYLTFTVPAENITAGNALIAVKNSSGTIVWSWHIWVTDQDWSTGHTTVSTGAHNYIVTPVNVGWTPGEETRYRYKGSTCFVKITADSGTQITFQVDQPDNVTVSSRADGDMPYYQHGRKDPFSPARGNSSTNKTIYDIDGNDITSTTAPGYISSLSGQRGMDTAIQNPTKLCAGSGNWETPFYMNNWDMNNTSFGTVATPTVKTVYDPCPPGFCVPTGNLIYFMCGGYSSRKMSTWSNTNGSYGATWNINITGDPLFFPTAGYRTGAGNIDQRGNGYYWSATTYSQRYQDGESLRMQGSGWIHDNDEKSRAESIRAVAEE